MAVEVDSPFKIVRTLIKKFLGEMRVIRGTSEEQAKARAEEIKSNSLSPGKSQYSVSEVDAIIRNFKGSYVDLIRDIHLVVVTESTTKIRLGVEQGFIQGKLITQEMMDNLNKHKQEAEKVPVLTDKLKESDLKIDELQNQAGDLKAETIVLQNEVTNLQNTINARDDAIEELARLPSGVGIDDTLIHERDQVIVDRDKIIHQITLEKTNLQAEYDRIKIEKDSLSKRFEDMESRLKTSQSQAVSQEGELYDSLQKQIDKSRDTIFTLRSQIAEKEDTIRNQKIDIQQRVSQIDSYKNQIETQQEEMNELREGNNIIKSEIKLLETKIEEQETATSKVSELSEVDAKLREQISDKERLIVDMSALLETSNQQLDELKQQIHQKDSDAERLAENMIEFQQELSSKETETYQLRTQTDEMMLQIAEKEAEIKEVEDLRQKEKEEVEELEEKLLEQQDKVEDFKARLEETVKELTDTKKTMAVMEKEGTMSSDEKYQYELSVQKHSKRIDQLKSTLKSLESFLNTDPKYRILYLLNDFQRPLAKKELAKMLKIPEEVATKYIFELDYFGYIKQNVISGETKIESTALLKPPLIYEEETENKE